MRALFGWAVENPWMTVGILLGGLLVLVVLHGCGSAERDPEPWHVVYVHPDAECPNAGGAYEQDGRVVEQEAGPGCEGE
jgi:hypothetical protein